MLSKELCRMNSKFVQDALSYALQKLKLCTEVPTNGDGKDKQFTLSFAPFKPIRQSLFLCDKKFHIESLDLLLLITGDYLRDIERQQKRAFEQGARGRSEQLPGFNHFIDFEVQDEKFLLERFADEYKPFGCSLETVTDNSEEDLIFVEDLVALEGFFAIRWTLNHLINQKFMKTLSKRQDFHCFRQKTSKNLFSVMLIVEIGASLSCFFMMFLFFPCLVSRITSRRIYGVI
ncbi:hypothetical protein NC652_009401 [Populus alba x Populus x berolinensis]|nr:hypothetical protein NC652_009401 [Populus alba x Populus x berolinensis]